MGKIPGVLIALPGRIRAWRRAVGFTAVAIALSGCHVDPAHRTPDLVLVNGTVLTVDGNDRIAAAVAIRGDPIVAVGSTRAIEALAGATTRRIDLAGRTVTPGLLDAHAHFSPGPFNRLDVLDLSYPDTRSIEDVKEAVARQARETTPGGWVQGRGWADLAYTTTDATCHGTTAGPEPAGQVQRSEEAKSRRYFASAPTQNRCLRPRI